MRVVLQVAALPGCVLIIAGPNLGYLLLSGSSPDQEGQGIDQIATGRQVGREGGSWQMQVRAGG